MGYAQRKDDMDDVLTVNQEANRRIDSARVRQLAFQIKNLAAALTDEDAEQLAEALIEGTADGQTKPDGQDIRERLQRNGRSRDRADKIARAVGL